MTRDQQLIDGGMSLWSTAPVLNLLHLDILALIIRCSFFAFNTFGFGRPTSPPRETFITHYLRKRCGQAEVPNIPAFLRYLVDIFRAISICWWHVVTLHNQLDFSLNSTIKNR